MTLLHARVLHDVPRGLACKHLLHHGNLTGKVAFTLQRFVSLRNGRSFGPGRLEASSLFRHNSAADYCFKAISELHAVLPAYLLLESSLLFASQRHKL